MKDDVVLAAAKMLVSTLEADPVFVEHVSRREIDRRVEAGLLIPVERLQVAPGLTLAPAGRVEELEAMLDAVVQELGDALPQPLADKIAGLIAPAVVEEDPGDEEPALPGAHDEPESETDSEVEEPAPEEAAEETTDGRPQRRRLPTEPGQCRDCGTDLDLDQTRFSSIRFPKEGPLCKPCMASH